MKTKSSFSMMGIFRMIIMLCMMIALIPSLHAQDPAQYGTPFAGVPDPRDVNMYQVHIRPFSAAGNLPGVTAQLDRLKTLGINVIYLMPIYPHGTDSKSSASPYCIKDFKAVASEYGSLADMRALVDGAHSRGMAVMLDIAINGTSWDHAWTVSHPEYYIRSGTTIQQLGPFADIAALDLNNSATRTALIDAMRYWIFAANIDGYRCDYANNPPLSFWTQVISNLRGITSHKLLMLAEGDRLENFQTGFDFNFGDKWYYDAIKAIANGTSVAQIQTTTNTEYTYATGSQQEIRYTANHDTETTETAIGVFKSHAGVVANFLVSGYMRGAPFLASGQEADFNQTIPWPYQSVKINWSNTGAAADFTKVLNFRTASNAIRRGTMTNYSDANVCAFTKISGSEKVVVIVNLRNSTQNYVTPSALAGSYTDAYTNAAVTLTSGATQSLAAFQYKVLKSGSTSACPITPYLTVNGGAWQQTATASLAVGGSVIMGPQPSSGGSWSWTGPNGFSSTAREITITNIQSNQAGNYVATYNNGAGCTSTQTFTITVTGGPSLNVSPTSLSFGSAASSGTITITSNVAWTVTDNQTWITTSVTSGSNNGSFTVSATANTGAARSGTVTVTGSGLTQTISVSQSAPVATTYYAFKNRWKNTYLYDAGANVGYGTTIANNNYKWVKETIDATYFWIRNLGTGEYMHIENQTGSVQCTAVDKNWWSSQWSQDNIDGTWVRIRNRWQTGSIIHVEGQTGSAQYAGGQDAWYSAQWQLVSVAGRMTTEGEEVVEDNAPLSVDVFPNPSKENQFTIAVSGLQRNESATVTLHDVNGKVAFETRVLEPTKVDHNLPAGLYLIRACSNGKFVTKRISIEH
jgi:hypothetical protein